MPHPGGPRPRPWWRRHARWRRRHARRRWHARRGRRLPPPPAATLKSAKVRACQIKGKGKRLRLRCTFTGFGAVKKVSLKVTRKGRVVSRGSGKPTKAGLLAIKPSKKLRKGSYKVAIKLTDAAGKTRTLQAKLKVR